MNVFNAGSWRIGNDCATFRLLQPSYKWRLRFYGAHTPNLLPFPVCNRNLCETKRQSLVVFARHPHGDSVSVLVDLLPVGVVFFPSLPFMGVVLSSSFVLGDASLSIVGQ